MKNYRLDLSYDGGRYDGWQRQGNSERTIQHKVEDALSRLLEQPVEAAASGRTDAGVHARRQTVSFRADTSLSCAEILAGLRAHLPADIGALSLSEAPPRFHARLSCREKTYCYRLWVSGTPCVFERRYVWVRPGPLDVPAMERAAALLCGTHDFSAFRTGRGKKSAVRTLRRIDIRPEGDELRLYFTGDGFLYNMVRILAGTLAEVGEGKRAPEEMTAILASLDRQQAGPTAPAQGLFLWDVSYGD